MNSAANQDINVKASTSKEDFWKRHTVLQKNSGLSRAEYCRKNQLNYACFGYWLCKWRRISPKLIPVTLTSSPAVITESLLCTLTFKRGRTLTIHDKSIIPLILSSLD
ncbi:MAG: hypothetical protein EBY22_11660 [Gammaproteobacteria bacterium]|nr:hypothetical protein [Gammaproteobacteria bacterium]